MLKFLSVMVLLFPLFLIAAGKMLPLDAIRPVPQKRPE